MFNPDKPKDTENCCKAMVSVISDLLENESDLTANLSMISAIINFYIGDINWAGFYIMKKGELVLGPFQGLPACIRIQLGRGVCGAAAQSGKVLVVENVHEFEGHIACDSASNSEIVLPLFKNGEVFGVLDIDSPLIGRFGNTEEKYLRITAEAIGKFLDKNF